MDAKAIETKLTEIKDAMVSKIKEMAEKSQTSQDEVGQKITDIEAKYDQQLKEMKEAIAKRSLPGVEDEKEKFSFSKAAAAMLTGNWDNAGFEKSVFEGLKQRVTSVTGTNGVGYLVPVEIMNGFVDLALAKMPLYDVVTKINNVSGDLELPVLLTRPDGANVGESGASTEINYTWGNRRFSPKRASGFTKISYQAMKQTSLAIENLIQDQLMKSLRVRVDKTLVNGTGTQNEPLGILQQSGFTTTTASGSTRFDATQAQKMVTDIEEADHDTMEGTWGFLTRPVVVNGMKMERIAQYSGDTTGQYAFVPPILTDEQLASMVGFPFMKSTHVPKSNSATQTSVVFGDWSEFMLAIWGDFKLRVSNDASDTSSNSAFLNDETWLIVDMYYDCQVGDKTKFAKVTDASVTVS